MQKNRNKNKDLLNHLTPPPVEGNPNFLEKMESWVIPEADRHLSGQGMITRDEILLRLRSAYHTLKKEIPSCERERKRKLFREVKKRYIKLVKKSDRNKLTDLLYVGPDSGSRITDEEFKQMKSAFADQWKNKNRPRESYHINCYALRLTAQYKKAIDDKDKQYAEQILEFVYQRVLGRYIGQQRQDYGTIITKQNMGRALSEFDLMRGLNWRDRYLKKDESGRSFDVADEVNWYEEIKQLLF